MSFSTRSLFQLLVLLLIGCTILRGQTSLRIRPLVPDASLPCSAEEARWWSNLQTAARAVFRTKGAEDEQKVFSELLAEGRQQHYQIPIPDQRVSVISMTEPAYSEAGRINRVSGDIALKVEFLADGTVGQVTPVNTLGFGLDQQADAAAKKTIFLPAVKDRKFVDYTSQMHMTFSTY